jgi:DNA-binding transcriptional ArsR family regulator
MFEASAAKREILQRLAQQDWSPTDLAEELDKSPETIYNHLRDLEEQGILTKTEIPAKTRPKTVYSIGDGLIQYITVLPGQFREGLLTISETKEVMFRIWAIPQDEFHPYLERYWWTILTHADLDQTKHVTALGVYGSVARGEADKDSDIDLLAVARGEQGKSYIEDFLGSAVLDYRGRSRMGMTEVYTEQEYRNSLAHESDFLNSIRGEMHPIYDPKRVLIDPEQVLLDE